MRRESRIEREREREGGGERKKERETSYISVSFNCPTAGRLSTIFSLHI